MPSCSVLGCKNNNIRNKTIKQQTDDSEGIKFFRFPKELKYRKKWIEFCHKDNLNIANARICSEHFTKDCYIESYDIRKQCGYSMQHVRLLKDDALPTKKPSIEILQSSELNEQLELNKKTQLTTTSKLSVPEITKFEIDYLDDTDDSVSTTNSTKQGPSLEEQFAALKEKYDSIVKERDELQKKIEDYEEKEEKMNKILEKVINGDRKKARLTFEDISYIKLAELNKTYNRLKKLRRNT